MTLDPECQKTHKTTENIYWYTVLSKLLKFQNQMRFWILTYIQWAILANLGNFYTNITSFDDFLGHLKDSPVLSKLFQLQIQNSFWILISPRHSQSTNIRSFDIFKMAYYMRKNWTLDEFKGKACSVYFPRNWIKVHMQTMKRF